MLGGRGNNCAYRVQYTFFKGHSWGNENSLSKILINIIVWMASPLNVGSALINNGGLNLQGIFFIK